MLGRLLVTVLDALLAAADLWRDVSREWDRVRDRG